jgi:hypothetical protein
MTSKPENQWLLIGDSASLRFLSPAGVRALVETLLQLEAKRSGAAAQRTDFRRTAEAKP